MARRVRADPGDIVASTRIACGGARHTVRRHRDGTFEAPDCRRAVSKARALCLHAARGIGPGDQRGCAGLIALAIVLLGLRASDRNAERWHQLHVRYARNAIILTLRSTKLLASSPVS